MLSNNVIIVQGYLLMQVDNTCFPAKKETNIAQAAIPFTTTAINLLVLFSYYWQSEGILCSMSV